MADGVFMSILDGIYNFPENAIHNVNCSFGKGFARISPLDSVTAILYTMIFIDKNYSDKEVDFIHSNTHDKAKSEIIKNTLEWKYKDNEYHREDAYGKAGCKYYDHWCIRYYVKIITEDKSTSKQDIENLLKTMIKLMAIKGISPCKIEYIYSIGSVFSYARNTDYGLEELTEFIELELQKIFSSHTRYDSHLPPKDYNEY